MSRHCRFLHIVALNKFRDLKAGTKFICKLVLHSLHPGYSVDGEGMTHPTLLLIG